MIAYVGAIIAALLVFAAPAWAAPANNDFADAATLSGTPAFDNGGSNVGANKETGEPNHAGDPGGASVWYSWTAPSTGPFSVDTCIATFDTLIGVYTGTSVGALTTVGGNDQSGGPLCPATDQSEAVFNANAGMTYRIAVDGWSDSGAQLPDQGSFVLRIQSAAPPANDDFAGAAPLQDLGNSVYGVHGSNEYASLQAGEPDHADEPGGGSVWYRWTAPVRGTATLKTCNTSFDTLLAAYLGDSITALAPVGSNDDGGSCSATGGSGFSFPATQGETYRIAVDGLFGDRGEFDLFLQFLPQPETCAPQCSNSGYAPGTAHARINRIKVDSKKRTATIRFSADQKGARFKCQLDNGRAYDCRSPVTLGRHRPWRRLGPGKHRFIVLAIDSAGRFQQPATVAKFRIKKR
jgi:hypothetical protein